MARIETQRQKQERLFTNWVIVMLNERNLRQKDLADYLGITQQAVSKKCRYLCGWSLAEMADCVEFFGEPYTVTLK